MIELMEMMFHNLPATLKAGKTTWEVTNIGAVGARDGGPEIGGGHHERDGGGNHHGRTCPGHSGGDCRRNRRRRAGWTAALLPVGVAGSDEPRSHDLRTAGP